MPPFLSPDEDNSRPISILDRIKDQAVCFKVAGYSKHQYEHRILFDALSKVPPVPIEFQFVKESANQYDAKAIRIDACVNEMPWMKIGYIPRIINNDFHINWSRISQINLYTAASKQDDKFYSIDLIVGYDGKTFRKRQSAAKDNRLDRFDSIGE